MVKKSRALLNCFVTFMMCSCLEISERPIEQDPTAKQDASVDQDDSDRSTNEEVCDGEDNDGDGRVDEIDFGLPTQLIIQFSANTALGDDGRIEITDGAGNPIEGSPFRGDELVSRSISVNDHRFRIHLIIDESGDRTRGYEITQVTAQDGRVISGPYPQPLLAMDGLVSLPIDDRQSFTTTNSLGGGAPCGDSELGACRLGTLVCRGGQLLCIGERAPEPERCDGVDNDCDGAADEAQDLEAMSELCPLQDGVCGGARARCINAEWTCNADVYGAQYQASETRCDCLDNDCDGDIDQAEGRALDCTFEDLMDHATGRHCVFHGIQELDSGGTYRFDRLTIASDAELSVRPSPDHECGGYSGDHDQEGEVCLSGGGCLTLIAKQLSVSGVISVDAQSDPTLPNLDRLNCGGASGGDLIVITDQLKMNGGVLRANGSDGYSGNYNCGGGAAGHIRIQAEHAELVNNSVIEAQGGDVSEVSQDMRQIMEVVGGGPGSAGGAGALGNNGSINRGGGGGAGGPGAAATGGEEDATRGFEMIGHLTMDTSSNLKPHNGDGDVDGYLTFGGQSIGVERSLNEQGQAQAALYPLVIRLKDEEGRARSEVPVELSLMRDDQAQETFLLGVTDKYGWIKVDPSARLPQGETRYLLTIDDLDQGSLFVSYYADMVECTQTYRWSEGALIIPNFATCEGQSDADDGVTTGSN